MAYAYDDLLTGLRKRIGDSVPGSKLPTEAELCQAFSVSRVTVRRAYGQLVAEGLVERVPGRGSFVAPKPIAGAYYRSFGSVEDLIGLEQDTTLQVVVPFSVDNSPRIANEMQLPLGDAAVIQFTRTVVGAKEPMGFTRVWVPKELGAKVADGDYLHDGSSATVVGVLSKVLGVKISGATQEITAVSCSDHMASLLSIKVGSPLLLVRRRYSSPDGSTIELAETHYDPEQYTYRVHLARG